MNTSFSTWFCTVFNFLCVLIPAAKENIDKTREKKVPIANHEPEWKQCDNAYKCFAWQHWKVYIVRVRSREIGDTRAVLAIRRKSKVVLLFNYYVHIEYERNYLNYLCDCVDIPTMLVQMHVMRYDVAIKRIFSPIFVFINGKKSKRREKKKLYIQTHGKSCSMNVMVSLHSGTNNTWCYYWFSLYELYALRDTNIIKLR